MLKISVLNLEQRIDPIIELEKLFVYLKEHYFYSNITYMSFLNRNINLFPFCGTSMNFDKYFEERGVKISNISNESATLSILNIISLYFTIELFLEANKDVYEKIFPYSANESNRARTKYSEKMKNIFESLLIGLNYQITYGIINNEYGFFTPYIVKRDVDVDSVLPLVTSDIRLCLLSYLDFRVENNLEAKRSILVNLYSIIIDDGKSIYEGEKNSQNHRVKYQNELYRTVSQICNLGSIRHGGEIQIELTNDEKHEYYDKCFYLILQLIRMPRSIEDIDLVRHKFNPKKR